MRIGLHEHDFDMVSLYMYIKYTQCWTVSWVAWSLGQTQMETLCSSRSSGENYSIFILSNNFMHAKCLGHSTRSSSSSSTRRKQKQRTHSSCPVISSCSNCSVNSSSNGNGDGSRNGNGSKRFLWIRGAANRILSHHVALAAPDRTVPKRRLCWSLIFTSCQCVRAAFRLFRTTMQDAFHLSSACVWVRVCVRNALNSGWSPLENHWSTFCRLQQPQQTISWPDVQLPKCSLRLSSMDSAALKRNPQFCHFLANWIYCITNTKWKWEWK